MDTESINQRIFLLKKKNVDLFPWDFLSNREIVEYSKYLGKKYNWCVYPFARNGDDFVCLVTGGKLKGKFIILHDFAEPGWEFHAGNEMESFGMVLDSMLIDALEMMEAD